LLTTSPPHFAVAAQTRPSPPRVAAWRPGVDLLAIGALALLLRMAVIVATTDSGVFSDMVDYHTRAQLLLSHRPWPDSVRGPGYPGFLTLLYFWSGHDLIAARVGNALLATVTAMLTVVMATDFVDRRAALAAGAAVAVYPASVLSSVYLMPEGLYGLLILLTLLAARRATLPRSLVAGLLTGLAALTRSLGIGLLPTLAAGHCVRGWRERRWRHATAAVGITGLACALTLVPWLSHTVRVSGGPMLDSTSAVNILIGANPRARERLQLEDGDWLRTTYLNGATNEAELNRRALQASWGWITQNPGAWLRLLPLKASYLWGLEGREHAWAFANSYFGERDPVVVWLWSVLLITCLPLLAVPAIAGLCRPGLTTTATGVHVLTLLAVVTLMHAVSFGETRFHLPMIPLLAALAVRGVAGVRAMTPVRWLVATALAVAIGSGWLRQLPELMERLHQVTTPDGWRLMLPY